MAPIPRSEKRIEVQTFYHFVTLSNEEVMSVRSRLIELANMHSVNGLIILGTEGLNATVSGDLDGSLDAFTREAAGLLQPGFEFLNVKTSHIEIGEKLPFLDFVVKVRKEIVTLQRPDLMPKEPITPSHLSPEDWHRQIQSPDAVIIDTRNAYESSIGTFKNAITPDIEEFSEFPQWLEAQVSSGAADKSKPTYIFCTGGIRCEKAILAMEEKGFEKVYQLDGGILNYIEQFPQTKPDDAPETLWEGECFVFDHRIAVDGDGRASRKFTSCPHCGQAAEHPIFCVRCDGPGVLCDNCFEEQSIASSLTCSKNCAHHWNVRPGQKGKAQRVEDLKPRKLHTVS